MLFIILLDICKRGIVLEIAINEAISKNLVIQNLWAKLKFRIGDKFYPSLIDLFIKFFICTHP